MIRTFLIDRSFVKVACMLKKVCFVFVYDVLKCVENIGGKPSGLSGGKFWFADHFEACVRYGLDEVGDIEQ